MHTKPSKVKKDTIYNKQERNTYIFIRSEGAVTSGMEGSHKNQSGINFLPAFQPVFRSYSLVCFQRVREIHGLVASYDRDLTSMLLLIINSHLR